MGNNFYQMNNEVLKLDPYNKKDLEYIQFNNYICRKENLQRIKNELDRGLFKLSYTTIIEDTGLSRNKVQRIMKWFEDNGIIECIDKSSKKGKESIYAYTSVYYSEEEQKNSTDFNTNFNTNLSSNSNGLSHASNTDFNTNNSTSKKENKKEKLKSSTSTEFYSFAELINRYTDNDELVEALEGFISMRELMYEECNYSKLTTRAFNNILKKLDKYADNDEEKIFILDDAIMYNSIDIQPLEKIKEIKKAPTGAGTQNKNNNVNSSICNNRGTYSRAVEVW